MPFARITATSLLACALPAQTLIWPGERISTIDAPHLRAHVPTESAERLEPLIARADQIYAHMIDDAGFEPQEKLHLLVSDWTDSHNGYSFVVPFPLVQLELAPAMPGSPIFAGGMDSERTLVHEFAHQISNDRNGGGRGVLESIFGRVLPNDLLSLLLWYASTPAHQTMPRFWQEGLGVWAETSYADPTSAWAGRGRDSLTHMIWRLDAATGGIPDESQWRITQQEWPFGSAAYHYGTAYTRFLEGKFGDRASVWRIVREQARQWAFLFDRGARDIVGERHGELLAEARRNLLREQLGIVETLKASGLTRLRRLTPDGMLLGAPAWDADGSLVFAGKSAHGRARLHRLSGDGEPVSTWDPTLALGAVRALPDGGITYHEYDWRGYSYVVVATEHGTSRVG
ncbi:MAG: hypothetical protein KDC98_05390, partial [Planctomycetes bacterium]|nr:hypothetical protein [Planctomycetota bacterium]